ncbi:InlB B-repeat-containing protein, partial [Candidatus Saccharibacteria bacterium]|nr:InlB B-repeat-containing protein [Candidatus Saccharibacteria bacterium]
SITFDANAGSDTVTNIPTGAQLSGADVILPFSPVPTRTGYRFLGWDTDQNAIEPTYTSSGTNSFPIDPELDQSANTRTLYAIWGCGQICYHGNGADAGEMGDQTISNATSNGLIASNFSRAGYGFAGWNTKADGSGTTFGPNEVITANDAGEGLDLYAKWVPAAKDGNNNPIYLQGWTGCSAMHDGDVTALTDNRDGNVYAIAKIEKNVGETNEYSQCWLIENLRLDVATTNITSVNTNHPTAAFRQEAATLDSAFWDTCTSSSSACHDHISYSLANMNRNYTASYNTNNQTTSWYSYGGMYNWYTATAGHGTYSKPSGNTDGSICPSGWSLPSGKDAMGDFGKLDIALGGTGTNQSTSVASKRWRTYPVNFVYSGMFSGSSANNRSTNGNYWSSTVSTPNMAYVEGLRSNYVAPGTNVYDKYGGLTVRCLTDGDSGALEQFTLTYSANGGDEDSVPQPQTSATLANSIYTFTLSNTIPTRSDFTFAGWIDEDGNEGQAGGQYIATRANTTLYARWTNNTCNPLATTIGTGNSTDAKCLQDVNSTVKSTMQVANSTTGTYTLIDARDNKSYTIAKLDDGEVWMTQNLNYGSSSDILLTSYDTDIASGSAFKAPASTTAFETTDSEATRISPKILTDDTYGGYYSYAAAIASTDKYTTSNQNITTSICPSGWDLPTSTQYSSLKSSAGLTNFATASAAPYSFIRGGYRNGTSFSSQTSDTRLWTSTNSSESYAYYTTGYGSPSSNYKRYGESVRCIASNGTASIKYYKNDGTSDFVTQNNININSDKLYSNSTFSRGDAYIFKEWNTTSTGDGANYASNADISTTSVQEGQTLELYAIWNTRLKVIYHANYEGSSSTSTQWIEAGTNGTLGGYNKFSRTGYKIVRWDTNPSGEGTSYATSSSYAAPANTQAGDEFHLYAIWDQTNTVIYNANGGRCEDTGTATDTCMQNIKHTNVALGDTFGLFASNYSRSGYGFVGWSTDPNAQPGGNSTIYGPNETIAATSDFIGTANASHNITLYAIWVVSSGDIQNFSCSSLANIGDVTALTDTRDNQVYAVAKLKDGNCWMIENLRLEATNSRGANNIAKSQGYASGFTGLADAETANFSTGTTANSLYSTSIETGKNQITGGSSSYYAYRFPRYNNSNTASRAANPGVTNNVTSANSQSSLNASIYSYGNYYTWAAVIADTGEYNTSYKAIASTSLCPTGWHLPYGYSGTGVYGGKTSGGFSYLDTQLESPDGSHGTGSSQSTVKASQRWRTYPNNFLYAGSYSGSSASRGSIGYYWSSMVKTGSDTYNLNLQTSSVNPSTNARGKYYGHAVRCVASNSYTLTVSYGAGVTSVLIDNNPVNDGQSITTMEGTKHAINMTFSSGYEFDSWASSDVVLDSTSTQSTTFVMSNRNATLTANGKPILLNVIYNANGGDCGNNTDTCMQNLKHTNIAQGDTLNLYASNYSRSGYGYAGWSTEQLNPDSNTFATDLATAKAAGLVYGPNETIEATSTFMSKANATNNITLYAIWVAPEQGITMQTFDPTASPYSSMSNGSIIALSDARDTNVYTVAKLADGKWWMIENLRLDTASTQGSTNKALSQGYGGVFAGLANPESTNFSDSTVANSLYSTTNITGYAQGYRFPRYNNNNTANRATNPTSKDANIYSYGNYYTWAAATANTADHGSSVVNQSITTTSICPVNWHLPTGGDKDNLSSSEWWTLTRTVVGSNPANYGSSTYPKYIDNSNTEGTDASKVMRRYPINLVYSGYFNNSSPYGRGREGYLQSSTFLNSVNAYTEFLSITYLYPGTDALSKFYGMSIRCVSNAAATASNNTNSNNASSQNSPQQQNVQPQAAPSATPSAQNMSLSAPTNAEPTNTGDQTEEETSSEETNTAPLGVKKSSDETNVAETVATTKLAPMDDSDVFGLVALVGAGVATTSSLLLLAGRRRKEDEEDETKN